MSEADAVSIDFRVIAGLLAIGLALVHLFGCRMRLLRSASRSRWLSLGSGVSVAYVFVHILPDLSSAQETIQQQFDFQIAFLEHHVYLVAMLGLAAFYGLERVAKTSRQRNQAAGDGDVTSTRIFWLHIASFALYNALIGYLLMHREVPGLTNLLFFSIAMALHFLVNDNSLREHHKKMYDKFGRWILAAAVVAGAAIGMGTEISQAAIAVLFAFLAGGIILNVLKEELPEDRESHFWSFAVGAIGYAVLLLGL